MMKLVVVLLTSMAVIGRAQEITICRQGQTMTISVASLSPYDELGNCRVSDSIFTPEPTSAPTSSPSSDSNPNSQSPTSDPTTAPSSSSKPDSQESSSDPTTAPTTMPAQIATLGPNAIVPDNATTPMPSQQLPIELQSTVAPTLISAPNLAVGVTPAPMPAVSTLPSNNGINDVHDAHQDLHDWQATGSFSHGHMMAVAKANKVLPANLDPNDPKTRVFVFLQWFSSASVYDNPQQVFLFFAKPQDTQSQRFMRIN